MQLVGAPGQHLITYYADSGTPEHDALVFLDNLGAQTTTASPSPSHARQGQLLLVDALTVSWGG
jgi:hypothetical protein